MSTGGRKTRRRYQSRLTSTLPSSTLALWWVWLLEHSRCLSSFLLHFYPFTPFLPFHSLSFLSFMFSLILSSLSPSSSSLSFSPSSFHHNLPLSLILFSLSPSFSPSSFHSQTVECPDDSLNHLVTVAAKRLHTALAK